MSERYDVLFPRGNLPYFTVDNTKAYVALQYTGRSPILHNAVNDYLFGIGDNFTILSYGVILPLSFQLDRSLNLGPGTSPVAVTDPIFAIVLDAIGQHSGKQYIFREVNDHFTDKSLYMIMENFDTAANIFINLQKQDANAGFYIKDEPFYINMGITGAYSSENVGISMAGVPDSLNGTIQYVTPYLKILHNFPLTST
jgi:hypothetical protein